ncbi:hypothetical protein BDQ17DRAFT_1261386 [Cyathus striatus]|nr:hypothetical protein BDQ17DRAFT_1261386 [Cyathus striatus]
MVQIMAGLWCPGKNKLATIQYNLHFSFFISHPNFIKFFGVVKPHPKGARKKLFGMDNELKVAPKGIDKGHKCNINLLRLHLFAVIHHFMDLDNPL